MSNINYKYHIFTGYLLAPIRILLIFSITFFTFTTIGLFELFSKNVKEKSIYYLINKFYVPLILYLLGITITIQGKENMNDKPKIIVGNHIHIYDSYILTSVYDKLNSFLTFDKFNIFPLSFIFRATDTILCNKSKKMGTIDKIKNHIKNKKSIIIFPDACNIIPKDKNIADFKNGAFIPLEPIQPILIRYIPSSCNNFNLKNESLLNHLVKSVIDGQIDVRVKILPVEEYNEDLKNHENYKEKIYNLMSNELTTLPKQYPPRLEIKNCSNEYTMNYLLYISFSLGLINYYFGIYNEGIKHFILFITGYFGNFYQTSNTKLTNNISICYILYDTFINNELEFNDYNIQRLYLCLTIIYGMIFYTYKIKYEILFEEKNSIISLIPGYICSLYINIFYLCNVIYLKF